MTQAKPMSFADMAKMPTKDIPQVLPLPPGLYYVEGFKVPSEKPTAKGLGIMRNFMAKIISPVDDFENPELLEEYTSKSGSPAGQVRTIGFYWPMEPNIENGQTVDDVVGQQTRAINDIRRFLEETCKLTGETIEEMLAAYHGCRFILQITHEADNRDPTKIVERVGRALPLE